ncbi:hypothetical protein MRY82_02545 [bacterium]|nr:hypothetical protein [bacterium]
MHQKYPSEFETALLNMFSPDVSMPDNHMQVEHTEYIDRYIGPGDAAFYYSLHLKKACSQEKFIALIKHEIKLAQKKQRKAFELRLFPLPQLTFSPDLLKDLNFEPPRILDFFYTATDTAIATSNRINHRRVQNDQDFKLLLSLLEHIFGPPSETLAQYFQNGLKHEVLDSKKRVAAYISFLDDQPAGVGWIKLYNKIGFLFGGGTLIKYRKQGVYRANVCVRKQFAQQHGADFVVSESSEQSALALNTLSFTHLGKSHSWVYRFDH